jgi:hypothetical protein
MAQLIYVNDLMISPRCGQPSGQADERFLLPDPDRPGARRGRPARLPVVAAQGQYEDLDGAAERILFDDDVPLKEPGKAKD